MAASYETFLSSYCSYQYQFHDNYVDCRGGSTDVATAGNFFLTGQVMVTTFWFFTPA